MPPAVEVAKEVHLLWVLFRDVSFSFFPLQNLCKYNYKTLCYPVLESTIRIGVPLGDNSAFRFDM